MLGQAISISSMDRGACITASCATRGRQHRLGRVRRHHACRSDLNGLGNFDQNVIDQPEGRYEACTLRLYHPDTKQWSLHWIDGRDPKIDPPLYGASRMALAHSSAMTASRSADPAALPVGAARPHRRALETGLFGR